VQIQIVLSYRLVDVTYTTVAWNISLYLTSFIVPLLRAKQEYELKAYRHGALKIYVTGDLHRTAYKWIKLYQ